MPEETSTTSTVKTSSDGTVKLTVEKYNELVDKVAAQQTEIERGRDQLRQAREQPPVVNRTYVNKTPEMLAREQEVSGMTFMGLGAAMFAVGAYRFRAARASLTKLS